MKHTSLVRKIVSVCFMLIISKSSFAQGPFPIGTINPGDSIIIYYDVQINTGATGSISNQGTITGTGINTVTDDPDTGPAGDATITPLNIFLLPAVFNDFKAYQKNNDIEVSWKILTEANTLKYDVEKSADGRTFTKIGEVTARGGTGIINYTFLDINPFSGNNFYRLKVVDRDDVYKFTNIVRVVINGAGEVMSLYPNPVTGKSVNLELRNMKKGQYQFTVYSIAGQQVYTMSILHNGGSASQVIHLPASVSRGVYQVRITGGDRTINKKLVVD